MSTIIFTLYLYLRVLTNYYIAYIIVSHTTKEGNIMQTNMLEEYPSAHYNAKLRELELDLNHTPIATLTQLQHIILIAGVEHSLAPSKPYSYHLYDTLYRFNRKEAVRFLMVGVGGVFFEGDKDFILTLVGAYYLGRCWE